MLLGIKSRKQLLLRHVLVGAFAIFLVYIFWKVHSMWSPDMRLWKSFGAASFFLLWFAIFIGPASRLWKPLTRLVPWRREFGIWFALVALVHGYLVLDGWARWSVWKFLGYELVSQAGIYVRVEPGFGLANLMGLTALFFALILAATSSDRAVSFLGISSWKWLHTFTYVIFYIGALHVMYFAFIHFTPSPLNPNIYPKNPLRFYYLALILSAFLTQMSAFVKTVYQQRKFVK